MKLIRKVSLAKWKQSLAIGPDHISADAVTACLRTSNNTLSVWKSDSDEEYPKALLALVASLTSIETIDVITLTAEELDSNNLILESSPGETIAEDYKGLHRDIVDLDHAALKVVAELVKQKVSDNQSTRLTKPILREMLKNAVKSGEVNPESLPDKVRVELLK